MENYISSCIGRPANQTAISPKLIYRFNTIPIKSTASFGTKCQGMIFKFIWRYKTEQLKVFEIKTKLQNLCHLILRLITKLQKLTLCGVGLKDIYQDQCNRTDFGDRLTYMFNWFLAMDVKQFSGESTVFPPPPKKKVQSFLNICMETKKPNNIPRLYITALNGSQT